MSVRIYMLLLIVLAVCTIIVLNVIFPPAGYVFAIVLSVGMVLHTIYSYIRPGAKYEVTSPTTPIPENLQAYHNELISLGFQLIGEMKTRNFVFKLTQWVYFNNNHTIIAYTTNHIGRIMGFSTYFEDGFDVTTRYPIGNKIESDKIVIHIVTTNVTSALDYHEQHYTQHISEHGNPIQISSLEEHLDWERNQRYDRIEISNAFKLWGRILFAFLILLPVCGSVLLIIAMFIYSFVTKGDSSTMPGWVTAIVGFIPVVPLGMWAYRPLIKPESVEDRKKRKPKDEA